MCIGTGLSTRAVQRAGRGETFKSQHQSPVFMRFTVGADGIDPQREAAVTAGAFWGAARLHQSKVVCATSPNAGREARLDLQVLQMSIHLPLKVNSA